MTVQDYGNTSDFIDTIEADDELLDCMDSLQKLIDKCIDKMYFNLPKKVYSDKKNGVLTKKRKAWVEFVNNSTNLEMLIQNYKNG